MSFDADSVDLHGSEDLSILHWRGFFLVLAAEWAPAVFPDWGVPERGWAELRERARAFVPSVDDAWARARRLPEEQSQALQRHVEDELRALLGWVADAFGPSAASTVHEHGLLTPHTTPEFLWQSVLFQAYWGAPDTAPTPASLGISEAEMGRLRVLVEKHLLSPSPVDFVRELDARDQSEWASTYFQGRRRCDRENVVNAATNLAGRTATRALWSELRSVWPPEAIARLVAWGHAWAQREDIPVEWMPEPP